MATSRSTSSTTTSKTTSKSTSSKTGTAKTSRAATPRPASGKTVTGASGPLRAAAPAAPPAGRTGAAAAAAATAAGPGQVTGAAEAPQDTALRKRELIATVVEKTGVKKRFAKPVVEAMIDEMGAAMAEGRELNLQPFGRVKLTRTKESENARVIFAKIRQSKSVSAGPDDGKDTVADAAE